MMMIKIKNNSRIITTSKIINKVISMGKVRNKWMKINNKVRWTRTNNNNSMIPNNNNGCIILTNNRQISTIII